MLLSALPTFRRTLLTSALLVGAGLTQWASAAGFPDHAVTVVVPYSPAGGVDIAPTTDNLSKDVLEKIEDAKKDIIAGDLVVPKNQEEFEEKYGDVYELD